jgi:TetR/AcrR family transcriptional repressor of nem operon
MVGRPREFDQQEAIAAAMQLFWQKGYQAASMDDLLAAMGIQRGSLYAAFKDKRTLYLETLRAYVTNMRALVQEKLAGNPPLAQVRSLIRHMANDASPDGCLLMNAMSERGGEDPEVLQIVQQAMQGLEDMICAKLTAARDAGELTRVQTPRALARFLITAIHGFDLLAKQQAPRAVVQDNLRVVLSCLN